MKFKLFLLILVMGASLEAWKITNGGEIVIEIRQGSDALYAGNEVYISATEKTVHIPYHDIDTGVIFEREREVNLYNVRGSQHTSPMPPPPNIARCGSVGAATALKWDKNSESWLCVDIAIPNLTFFWLDGQHHTLQDCEESGGEFFAFDAGNAAGNANKHNKEGDGRYCLTLNENADGTAYTNANTANFSHAAACNGSTSVNGWSQYKKFLLLKAQGYNQVIGNICNETILLDGSLECPTATERKYTAGYIEEDVNSSYAINNTPKSAGLIDMGTSLIPLAAQNVISSCYKDAATNKCIKDEMDTDPMSIIEGFACH